MQPLFPGESGVDQLVEIIKVKNLVWHLRLFSPATCILYNDRFSHSALQVLGTPTREEIKCMNPNYTEFKFPQIKAHPWHKVMRISCLSYKTDAWLLGLHLNCSVWWTILGQGEL